MNIEIANDASREIELFIYEFNRYSFWGMKLQGMLLHVADEKLSRFKQYWTRFATQIRTFVVSGVTVKLKLRDSQQLTLVNNDDEKECSKFKEHECKRSIWFKIYEEITLTESWS